MTQTVIGIFDDASEAQTAMQELLEAGFSRNNIDLSTQNASETTLTVHAQSEDEAERAADILDDAGAIDVNEQAEHYQSGLTTGVSADPLAPIYGETPHIIKDE